MNPPLFTLAQLLSLVCILAFTYSLPLGFPGGASGKEPACQWRRYKRCRFNLWVGKIPWRRAWQPTPVFLPGESHGQKTLTGYSQGCKKSAKTEACLPPSSLWGLTFLLMLVRSKPRISITLVFFLFFFFITLVFVKEKKDLSVFPSKNKALLYSSRDSQGLPSTSRHSLTGRSDL